MSDEPSQILTLPVFPAQHGRAPNFEPVKELFWDQTFAFLNSYGDGRGDEVVGQQSAEELATIPSVVAPAVAAPRVVPLAW